MDSACECGRTYRLFAGGIIERVDDTLIIRGVILDPSAIEGFVRQFPEISEFSLEVYRRGELDEMEIRLEVLDSDPGVNAEAISKEIRNGLGMRVTVTPVPYGSLPRFEFKARQINNHRPEN